MDATKKKDPAGLAAGPSKANQQSRQSNEKSCRTEDQERRIIAALRLASHTTDSFRKMGIFQISARIWGLRAKGYVIDTARVTVIDREGFPHPRAALYSLVSEPEEVAA